MNGYKDQTRSKGNVPSESYIGALHNHDAASSSKCSLPETESDSVLIPRSPATEAQTWPIFRKWFFGTLVPILLAVLLVCRCYKKRKHSRGWTLQPRYTYH